MERIEFLVRGSAELPYRVTFERDGDRIIAFCGCAAGENGIYCKHRISILTAAATGLPIPNAEQVSVVASWLPGSVLAARLTELAEAEEGLELAKRAVAKAKKTLAAAMMGRG
jgi:hypothetical protein